MTCRFPLGLAALLMVLGGCDLVSPAPPKDAAAQTIPAPPGGTVQVYANTGDVSLQARPGDCAKTTCYVYTKNKWRPLPQASLKDLPLLAIDAATGSEYSDTLWRPVGTSGNTILLNRKAGHDNVESGLFDGLRIGLRDQSGVSYTTAYTVEQGAVLKAAGQCLQNDPESAGKQNCAPAAGRGLYMSRADIQVIVNGEKAWLLHRRPDGSTNLVDLFVVNSRSETSTCLPGLILATKQTELPVETALSPNIFISRVLDKSANATLRDRLISCALTEESKALP